MPSPRPRLRPDPDPAGALVSLGLEPGLGPDGLRVADLVPARFPVAVRILHPAVGLDGEPLRWREVADRLGVAFRADIAFEEFAEAPAGTTVEWAEKVTFADVPWSRAPERGSLDAASTAALVRALEGFAVSPDRCGFALWDGYGGEAVLLSRGRGRRRKSGEAEGWEVAPVAVLGRRFVVAEGPLSAAWSLGRELLGRDQSPNLWWDPAWLVVTDVDLMSTFVGCSESCAEAIVAEERLEAVPIDRNAWVSLRRRG